MPDGSNLSSILPSALPQAYSTPEESLAASQSAPAAPPTTSLDALPQAYSTPEESLAAQPAAPVSTPAPAQPAAATSLDALPQAYSTPEESLAAPQAAPPQTPVAAAAPPQQTGLISGILQGVGASGREAAQLATGNAFTTDPNAQPEPTRSWWNELGYGFGHSWPTVAAGFGGGAAGEAVGGPVGAVAGAALGVGGTSLLQDLVPAYQSAMAGGTMTHEQAVDYAFKHALASGAIGAATAPLFNLAPFKSVIGKILFQSLATQPVVGAAGRVGVPLAMGEPLPSGEQMVRGLGQDIVTGAAFGVGHEAGGRVYRAVRPGETPPPPGETPPASEPPPETVVPPPAPAPDVSGPAAAPTDTAPATEPVPAPVPGKTTEPVPVAPPAEPPVDQAAPATPASETPVPSETVPAPPAPAASVARTETETPSPASTEPATTGITPEEMQARAERLRQQFPLLGQNAAGEDVLERPDGKRIVIRANGWVDNETNALSGGEYEAAGGYNPKFKVVTPNPDLTRTPSPASTEPGWRPVEPNEVFPPGMRFRMNQTTGVSEVYDPAGVTAKAPPDDGSGSTAGRPVEPAPVGETGTAGLPGEQPGGVRPGDTPVGTADTQGAPPPDQGQTGQTPSPTESAPAPGVTATPPHEFTGQTTYSGSGRADQASAYNPLSAGVPIAGEGRYSAFDRNAAERYGPNITEHPIDLQKPLIIKSDQEWRALTREAGWQVPNPTGLPKDQVLGMTQRLKQIVQAKGHDGIIVHWDDSTPYDIDSQGRDIKLLRNVFDTPQVIDYGRPQENLQRGAALSDRAAVPSGDQQPSAAETSPRLPAEDPQLAKLQATRDALAAQPAGLGGANDARIAQLDRQIAAHEQAVQAKDPQLAKLQATRDALKAQPAGLGGTNEARVAQLDKQIAAREQTLQAKGVGGPRVGGRKTEFEGPPQAGPPKTLGQIQDAYKFNNGTSVYRSVFEQAGHNPDQAVNRPIEWQNKILTRHMQNTFGFKSVELAPDARGQVDQKIARDAMLDMTRATQDLMSSLGLPYEAASLNGRLKLTFDPRGKRDYHGRFSNAGEINIAGGANSFGHEWTHAVDHVLAERLTGNTGTMNDLLSRYARRGQLNPKDPVQSAFARVLNTMLYDKGAQTAREVDLQTKAGATDSTGKPTTEALKAKAQLARLEAAGSMLKIDPTEFRRAALRGPKPEYYADPAELLARAHESYLARQMENDGHDPRGAVMPDRAYVDQTNKMWHDLYPQAEERMAIFKAFDDLHAAMRNEDVLGEGKPAAGPANLGISDPLHYSATVPHGTDPQAVREIAGVNNTFKNQLKSALFDTSRPSAGDRPWHVRLTDYGRMVVHSHHGIMETIIKRAPKTAQPVLRDLMDRLAAAPGEGRYTTENFEERHRTLSRNWTNQFGKIIQSAGYRDITKMSNEESAMLRHALTLPSEAALDKARYPLDPNDLTGTGPSKPIPQNLITTAGRLRQLMDTVWDTVDKSGIDIGYARNGYYPRLYDQFKVTASAASKDRFLSQAHVLHSLMFDREMGDPGSDPAKLLEGWTNKLSVDERNMQPNGAEAQFTLAGHMNELHKNLRRQAEIEQELKLPPGYSKGDPAQLQAELTRLKADAQTIAEAAHPLLRDHTATLAADNWLTRIMAGGMHDFDTTGPSGKFLQTRALPPEADQIMREFMRTNPSDALPNYFAGAARRVAFAERFGANGEDLDAKLNQVLRTPGMDSHDAGWFKQQIDAVTGRQNTSNMTRGLQKISNYIHAAGSLALMPRAAWSALAEPMNAALATRSMKFAMQTFSNQFGQLMRTASARERTEMAEYLGTVTSAMHDSIMLSRMSADYADSPWLNNIMGNYYRITGLTQLTNAQRIAATAASHGFLAKLSRDHQGGGVNSKDNATRWFNELGLHEGIHADFAKWMTDFNGGRPTVAQLRTDPMASAYSLAARRLTDRAIQDPYKVDRAAMSSVPFVGLAFQLMSFNYQFQRNVLQPAMDNIAHAYQKRGMISAAGSAVHAAAMAGSMVLAGVLTTAMRQYLFAPDQWQKHEDDGDLGGYLTDLAMQRSGLNGTLDPIIQMFTNMRYDANMSSLLEGASINWLAKNAQDVISPFVMANDSPNTNTRYFNAARGAYNLLGVPAAALGLTKLGAVGGPLARVAAGTALQFGTSPGTAASLAGAVAGEKGTQLPKETPEGQLPELPGLASLPSLPSEGGEGAKGQGPAQDAGGGLIPWGLADDVAKPAWQVFGEPVSAALTRVPGPLKVLGGLGAAAYGAKSFLDTTAPWRGPDARPPKAAADAAARP